MKLAHALLAAFLAAVAFALAGLLVAIPNPHLWASVPLASSVYRFGVLYAGALHIALGAAALFALGVAKLGWRRTAIFFSASTGLSLGAELLGTGTGWPFGAYAYTSGLGPKILGRVPFSIPLSWFTMGLASYLCAEASLRTLRGAPPAAWQTIALGTWLLTAWDLVLDPAMAHPSLPLRFWEWHQTGPYLGMPLVNFAGWSFTGALFMTVSRGLWRSAPPTDGETARFAFAVYVVNLGFATVLSASVGLWIPILLAVTLGLLPALPACWQRAARGTASGSGRAAVLG